MKLINFVVVLVILTLYILTVLYLLVILNNSNFNVLDDTFTSIKHRKSINHESATVEIWSTAALGQYLWEHILNAQTELSSNGQKGVGKLKVGKLTFLYETGPGVLPAYVNQKVEYLVIVINGRTSQNVKNGIRWLDFIGTLQRVRLLFVIMLGSEDCKNDWIIPYLKKKGGIIDTLFITYDTPLVDNIHVFQWPLGVATYRYFPTVRDEIVHVKDERRYLCNFQGTVYANSSREELIQIIDKQGLNCFHKIRTRWEELETVGSMSEYFNILSQSELTLSPVGMNTECYRLYEAMSVGSIPVVEMKPGILHGECDSTEQPLRLIRKFDAPIIPINDWTRLPEIILEYQQLSHEEKLRKRAGIRNWYKKFSTRMKTLLIDNLYSKIGFY